MCVVRIEKAIWVVELMTSVFGSCVKKKKKSTSSKRNIKMMINVDGKPAIGAFLMGHWTTKQSETLSLCNSL